MPSVSLAESGARKAAPFADGANACFFWMPDIYLKAAAAVGVAPENCMVVEDAVAGVLSGKAAGCYVVGVRGSFGKEELIAAGADAFVDTTCDIVDILG